MGRADCAGVQRGGAAHRQVRLQRARPQLPCAGRGYRWGGFVVQAGRTASRFGEIMTERLHSVSGTRTDPAALPIFAPRAASPATTAARPGRVRSSFSLEPDATQVPTPLIPRPEVPAPSAPPRAGSPSPGQNSGIDWNLVAALRARSVRAADAGAGIHSRDEPRRAADTRSAHHRRSAGRGGAPRHGRRSGGAEPHSAVPVGAGGVRRTVPVGSASAAGR